MGIQECPRCVNGIETVEHVFRDCLKSKEICQQLGIRLYGLGETNNCMKRQVNGVAHLLVVEGLKRNAKSYLIGEVLLFAKEAVDKDYRQQGKIQGNVGIK
ncbi:hypothetical protein GOBAR_DD24527 [Gossypium barbadense]|nr:hypothetical protein GOBAR_DD24527 [Gossypium barbadense]